MTRLRPIARFAASMLLVTGLASCGGSSGWARTAALPQPAQLLDVSCPTTSWCAAVGADTNGAGVAFELRGRQWVDAPVHVPAALASVSCSSRGLCRAATAGGEVVTFRNGSWSAPTAAGMPIAPHGLSCASESFCVAVASSRGTGMASVYDGSRWTAPAPIALAVPLSVSCVAPGRCVAVGRDHADDGSTSPDNGTEPRPDTVEFDGHAWSGGTRSDAFRTPVGVSCTADERCLIVDDGGLSFSVEHAWSRNEVGSGRMEARDVSTFTSVSCVQGGRCTAVDDSGHAFSYDATKRDEPWSTAKVVAHDTGLRTISCASPRSCVALDSGTPTQAYAVGR